MQKDLGVKNNRNDTDPTKKYGDYLPIRDTISCCLLKILESCPGWVAQLVEVYLVQHKVAGSIPVGAHMGGSQSVFLMSMYVSLSAFLSLKN